MVKRLTISKKLQNHSGCVRNIFYSNKTIFINNIYLKLLKVNTICWSKLNPSMILSGSDDKKLNITNAFTGEVIFVINKAL